ncbi:MAG TPA: aminodeoxychorismate synthase component I [Longimicrobiales bacterium]
MILDFPGAHRNRERVRFGPPINILAATDAAHVRLRLRDAERAARAGAWVAGFIAYEAAPAFDAAFLTRPHSGPAPLAWFGVFDEPERVQSPAAAAADLPASWTPDVTRAEYDGAIRSIRDAIAAGAVYQVNHTLRFRAPCALDPAALYDALVAARHGVYHALIETPHWAIVSASPELFIDVRDGAVTTRPMKGTVRRGRWPDEDAATAARLAGSAKDRAENLMIVDLLRNDLGRIARFGSVSVRSMFDIETYPTVHQMTSTITARLRDDVALDDLFAAMFPCGSVTGAPKIAAMQQISALERSPRGPYCGAVGVIRPDGTATFNVAIRTLLLDRRSGTAVYGAGGGITWDSSADAEYDEAVAKAALLNEAVEDFELLETMRLEHGTIHRLDLHLARLAASARYWSFADDAERAAAAALERERAAAPRGAWRLRLTVARDASVSLTRSPLPQLPTFEHGAPERRAVERWSGGAGGVRRVRLADSPVDSRDRMLYHKTTARARYDRLRAPHPDAYDVLLHNEHGCITEFTIGNIVCEIDGTLLTPPLHAGLLPGTFRQQLLAQHTIREADIRIRDLPRVTRMWLINSVREWVEVELLSALPLPS